MIAAQGLVLVVIVTLLTFSGSANGAKKCEAGLLLPLWTPQEDVDIGERLARGAAYFIAMLYMFLGVSIVSDRFMGAIEVITSKEREVRLKRGPGDGDTQVIVVRVWNETVANLTLMALGSSAPEILLSIIEIIGKNYDAGELGPGTIVGSAAFNLFVIISICIFVIPDGEMRRIKHLRVFFVTAGWSVFAYIWLLVILKFRTPGVVEVWEGALTFFFFFATVGTAYVADRRLLDFSKFSKSYRLNKRGTIVDAEGAKEETPESGMLSDGLFSEGENVDEGVREFEQIRREYIELLRDLRKRNPTKEPDQLEQLAREDIMSRGPKTRAFYRMQATRKLVAGQSLVKKAADKEQPAITADSPAAAPDESAQVFEGEVPDPHVTSVFFQPAHYTVMESVGTFQVTVMRKGGDLNQIIMVDYKTEDGTASAGSDYVPLNGMLTFGPGEARKKIIVKVLNDDIFEEDEHFYIRLSRPRFAAGSSRGPNDMEVQLTNPFLATVMILDDDHAGIFNLADKEIETVESVGVLSVKVMRWSGARGKVLISYATAEGTAKAGQQYEHTEGKLLFENNETEKVIKITITEEESYQKDVFFYLQISHAVPLDDHGVPIPHPNKRKEKDNMTKQELISLEGWPKVGPDGRATIRIKESKEFKNTVDKLLQRANATLFSGTSWKEQFLEAITVNAGEDDEDKLPSCGDYVMHYLALIWKIAFALVPPTDLCGGFFAFFVSIAGIGVLTAVIGDLASHFGCSIGLKDSVTAIIFVALGTSIPDTFASKVAAVQDEYADASIGNVTGSNAVNVFLGIGIAWTIAACVHAFRDCDPATTKDCGVFKVDPGSLAFSVTLFCACAVIAIASLLVRRLNVFGGGELGGPARFKYSTAFLYVALWIFYISMSSLESYEYIQGF